VSRFEEIGGCRFSFRREAPGALISGNSSRRSCRRGSPMNAQSTQPIFTATEIANELRCSKAQVYRLIKGRVEGLTPLPTPPLRRKKVVMRATQSSSCVESAYTWTWCLLCGAEEAWIPDAGRRLIWLDDASEIAIRTAWALPTLHGPVLSTGGQRQ